MGRQSAGTRRTNARTITFVRWVPGVVVVTAFAWLVTVAPTVVSFAIAMGAAMA